MYCDEGFGGIDFIDSWKGKRFGDEIPFRKAVHSLGSIYPLIRVERGKSSSRSTVSCVLERSLFNMGVNIPRCVGIFLKHQPTRSFLSLRCSFVDVRLEQWQFIC